ncbi:Thyrostimulin beta-5 subunit like protein [Argiope bruennichi]|uniref:Thyrostimulin beta-5 subunit like protein n=1 Tax=Argiope bruennichi TaxID=94029 RepID=A0A8T0F2N7_ARGBR|nr:Thyrostimulin beta-5 subunit like protein [Argiope bruennichi]
MFTLETLGVLLLLASMSADRNLPVIDEDTLECHRREFTFKASQTDENGLQCWDFVTAASCWGRCDTGEIGDWRFPFKRPFHPVCMHENRELRRTILRNCDPGADLRLTGYEYYEALTCACYLCDSSSTSCQGIPTYDDPERKEGFTTVVNLPGRIIPLETIE